MEEFIQSWDRRDAAVRADADRVLAEGHVESFFSRVQRYVEAAERSCTPEEMLLVLYSGPSGEQVQVHRIGYHHPDLVVLQGLDSRGEVRHVLVNVSSLHLVLKKARLEPPAQPRKIGFAIVE